MRSRQRRRFGRIRHAGLRIWRIGTGECTVSEKGTVITDVGSVKQYSLREMEKYLNRHNGMVVVGGHPVAGTEKSGPENGFASLFKGRWCILTPDENSSSDAVARLTAMWEHCGMKVDTMEPAHHDKVMAAVSHLPQLIAYSIVGTVADLEGYEHKEIIKYSAGASAILRVLPVLTRQCGAMSF